MTKRISLVFDLPDDDMLQVNDMIKELLETFSGTTHLFEVRDPSKEMGDTLADVIDLLPNEILETFQDMVTCELIPEWNSNKLDPNKNMRTVLNLEILLDYIADGVMLDITRR